MVSSATRLAGNPIVYPELSSEIGTNINGPSLIRVPDWIPAPLGRYYLYFAHHQGDHIRLAYADDVNGPWKHFAGGVLGLGDTSFTSHIASPDVHVDNKRQRILMYFHGVMPNSPKNQNGQRTSAAISRNGLLFSQHSDAVLAPFYLRVFEYKNEVFGIAKSIVNKGGGVLLRSKGWLEPFTQVREILPRQRHAAVLVRENRLYVFYSRGEDSPERIVVSTAVMEGAPERWIFSEPETVLTPECEYEGSAFPIEQSSFGAIHHPVCQLRDPCVFSEKNQHYLVYSGAGESNLAIAEITITE